MITKQLVLLAGAALAACSLLVPEGEKKADEKTVDKKESKKEQKEVDDKTE